MKNEEKLLSALGDVKSSYILECSQYVGNEQKEVLLLKSRKPRWAHFSAVAAVMAMFITATLVFLPQARRESRETAAASRSSIISLGDGTQLKIEIQTGEGAGGFCPVQEISVCRGETLLQTIDESVLPHRVDNLNEGLFLGEGEAGQPDFRDLNFDGYTDIGLPALGRETDNLPYHYFLWDSSSGQYVYSFMLFGGNALELDGDTKELVETVNGDAGPIQRRYRIEDGGLQQVVSDQPKFQIQYDQDQFAMTTGEGGTFISLLQGGGSYVPVCEIQIEFMSGKLPAAAVDSTLVLLKQVQTSSLLQTEDWDRTILHVQYGEQWDSMVEDIYFVSAGVQGTFRLTSRYFVEAAEGYGTTFAQICKTFTPLSESVNLEAERAIMSFADGFFSGNWSDMEPYLYDPNGEISHEDVYTGNAVDIQTVALQGLEQLDEHIQESGTGTVSLVFRDGPERSYTYLSMDMVKTGGEYKISFFGLEK